MIYKKEEDIKKIKNKKKDKTIAFCHKFVSLKQNKINFCRILYNFLAKKIKSK